MLSMICTVLLIMVFFKLLCIAFRVGWGVLKIAMFLIFFPVIAGGLIVGGLFFLALPIILIAGIAGIATAA